MSQPIVFYDAVNNTNPPKCFSPNTWKVRAMLNFKNIPYKTEWLEFADVKITLEGLGFARNEPSESHWEYSCPAITSSDGTHVMESLKIANYLERVKPEPALHLDLPSIEQAQGIADILRRTIILASLYRLPDLGLNPKSKEYYHRDRARLIGASLYDIAKSETFANGAAWSNAEPTMVKLREALSENTDGPFLLGKHVCYSDFVIGGMWRIAKQIDIDGDVYGRLIGFDETFKQHEEAIQPWFERDSY